MVSKEDLDILLIVDEDWSLQCCPVQRQSHFTKAGVCVWSQLDMCQFRISLCNSWELLKA